MKYLISSMFIQVSEEPNVILDWQMVVLYVKFGGISKVSYQKISNMKIFQFRFCLPSVKKWRTRLLLSSLCLGGGGMGRFRFS